MDWQPIDTYKPDDQYNSVLVVDRGHVSEAYYNGESDSWWRANTSEHDFDACQAIYPTHWMPKPAPPAALNAEE